MTQALRESEDALIRLCKRALRQKSRSACTKPPARALSHSEYPNHSLPEERSAPFRALLDMYKNQLQELAQRSCFNLPSYGCLREGPDHAPRFKATVKFNNEVFEGPGFCSTLRQAEHAVAEVALQELSKRGPAQSLAAKMLDETGVCKNLLQETTQKAGIPLPAYTSNRTGPGHLPVYICTVDVGGRKYIGQSAKTKKQAEKNAAAAAWAALKKSQNVAESESDEQAQTAVVKALLTAPPEGDSELPSISAQAPLFQEQMVLPREPPRTSRLFGGVTSTGASWQGAEYGLPPKPSERVKVDVAVGTSGAEGAGGAADVAEGSRGAERVGLPPAPAPFNLFSAAPFREREWISPAEAKQAKAPASPLALAPLVVPRTLQAVYAKPGGGDDDDISDDESPTGKVLGELKKKDRPFG